MRLTFCAAAVICWQAFKGIRLTEKEGLELDVEADAEQRQLPQLPDRFDESVFLGFGSFASVFRATDTKHENIPVAVKVLNKPQTKCISECSTVQKLMKACTPPHGESCLGASHIVRCLEQSDPSSGTSWMSTELVEGKDFGYYFKEEGLPPNWNIQPAQQVIAQFVAALDFMERGGVSHGDLLSHGDLYDRHGSNVMVANLDSAPNLHIINFGLATSHQIKGSYSGVGGNAEVRFWLWPLMILPSHKFFGCLNDLKFEEQLATLLFDDSKPLSQTAEGSGISTDDMEKLLLDADNELVTEGKSESTPLKEHAHKACHAIDGDEPCSMFAPPKYDDVARVYCGNWPEASSNKFWFRDRWEKVCKGLPGGKACDERPAKDVATFVASVWTLMFKMQASNNEYWNTHPLCRTNCERKEKSKESQQLCESCVIKPVQDELETQYGQAEIKCDDYSCTIEKSEEEVVKIEAVCTTQCKYYKSAKLGSSGCCVTPEFPAKESYKFNPTLKKGETMGTILKAFPDHSQRGKLVEQMWQGLFSADGLSFLRKLIVDKADVGVLIKEPFVRAVLPTEPSTNQAADAYAAYPAVTCDDEVLPVPAKDNEQDLDLIIRVPEWAQKKGSG